LRNYELTVIFSPQIAEGDFPVAIEKVSQFIIQRGGSVTELNQWGRRRLAYPIKRFMEGNYVLTQFNFEPKLIAELETNLRMSDDILRYLIVKLEE
jgi:small subunit ribosomal protein S6